MFLILLKSVSIFLKGKQIKKFKLLYIYIYIFFFFSSQGVSENTLDSEWCHHWFHLQWTYVWITSYCQYMWLGVNNEWCDLVYILFSHCLFYYSCLFDRKYFLLFLEDKLQSFIFIFFFSREFQLIASLSNDRSLSSNQDTNQFFCVGRDWTPDLLYNHQILY